MKTLLASLLCLLLFASSAIAQRDLGANRFVLDDGTWHMYLSTSSGMTGDAYFYFPPDGGSAPPIGTSEGQTLRWDNTAMLWEASDLLINSGTRLGIGTTPSTDVESLEISSSSTSNDDVIGTYGELTLAPSGVTTDNSFAFIYDIVAEDGGDMSGWSIVGVTGEAIADRSLGAGPVDRLIGTFGSALNYGMESQPELNGVLGEVFGVSAATITDAKAVKGKVISLSGGTITNASALYAGTGLTEDGGIITNNYGVYIEEMTGGTTNTALIYDHPTTPFVIDGSGNVGVHTTTPNLGLDINGGMAIRTGSVFTPGVAGAYQLPVDTDASMACIAAHAGGTILRNVLNPVNGKILIIYSTGTGPLTIADDAGGVGEIQTMSGANIATTGQAAITLYYNDDLAAWIVLSVQD